MRTPSVSNKLAILYPGDREARDRADLGASRFASLFAALQAAGVRAEPAIYHDDFAEEVRAQLLEVSGVRVWHNPIEGGRTRQRLDTMLREVAAAGVWVSAHPDTIDRLGTKDVLIAVRDLPFGSDAWRVSDLDQLRTDVLRRLALGPRVLKQHRGHSGIGVWRIEQIASGRFALRHAQRGSLEEQLDFDAVVGRLAPYFDQGGHMIDQAWQPRLSEGMVRAYLVGERVAGFGFQAVNALYPAEGDAPPAQPGPRLYSGADDARFQHLRSRLESGWLTDLCRATELNAAALPLLWDADFMFGEHRNRPLRDLESSYVLCEINVSSVAPFPDSAIGPLTEAVIQRIFMRASAIDGTAIGEKPLHGT